MRCAGLVGDARPAEHAGARWKTNCCKALIHSPQSCSPSFLVSQLSFPSSNLTMGRRKIEIQPITVSLCLSWLSCTPRPALALFLQEFPYAPSFCLSTFAYFAVYLARTKSFSNFSKGTPTPYTHFVAIFVLMVLAISVLFLSLTNPGLTSSSLRATSISERMGSSKRPMSWAFCAQ